MEVFADHGVEFAQTLLDRGCWGGARRGGCWAGWCGGRAWLLGGSCGWWGVALVALSEELLEGGRGCWGGARCGVGLLEGGRGGWGGVVLLEGAHSARQQYRTEIRRQRLTGKWLQI